MSRIFKKKSKKILQLQHQPIKQDSSRIKRHLSHCKQPKLIQQGQELAVSMIFCKDRLKRQLKSSKIMRLTSQMPKLRKGRDCLLKYLTLMECTKTNRILCLYSIKEGSKSSYKDLKIIKMMASFLTTKV